MVMLMFTSSLGLNTKRHSEFSPSIPQRIIQYQKSSYKSYTYARDQPWQSTADCKQPQTGFQLMSNSSFSLNSIQIPVMLHDM